MIVRFMASISLLFSVLFMPLWVSVILALVGILYFSFFIEAIIIFLLLDLLYGVPQIKFFSVVFVSSIVILVCLVILELLKGKLRFYSK